MAEPDDAETFEDPAEAVDDPDEPIERRPLVCGNGTAWDVCLAGPCPACEAETERGRVEHAADVAAGLRDSKGYEPGDFKFRQDSLF